MKTPKFEVVCGYGNGCRNQVQVFDTKEEAVKAAARFSKLEPDAEYRVWTIDGDNSESVFVCGKGQS